MVVAFGTDPARDDSPRHVAARMSREAKTIAPDLLAAAEACGGRAAEAMPLACAVECIHTYRWFTTICRPWTTTIIAAGNSLIIRYSAKALRCSRATRCCDRP